MVMALEIFKVQKAMMKQHEQEEGEEEEGAADVDDLDDNGNKCSSFESNGHFVSIILTLLEDRLLSSRGDASR